MSSSEDEIFDLDVSGSESEDFAPTPKKATKGAAKKPASKPAKPAPKPKVTKKKTVADKENNVSDVEMSDDEPVAGPSEPAATGNAKKKSASETYQKLTQLEHILKRPDSYIGSVETLTQPMWAWDSENKRMVHRDVKYVPGFFKIVDEILVNAADNKINDANMDTLKVTIDPENNTISVYNNGRGIPIEMHSREKIYIPELIFGHLLSSSNYDDDEKKLTGGRNGYGAKLANIYSVEFTVETADKNSQQKYVQTWTDNMGKMGKAKITKNSRKEEYTRVTFKPDLKRFGMDCIDEDTVALLKKRVYDLAGTVKDVKVFLNDERLKIKNFKQYVELYLTSAAEQASEESGGAAQAKQTLIYEAIGDRWEVAFAVSDGTFQHVAFANHIATTKGGTHVTLMADQIAKNLIAFIEKKNKAAKVKPAQIRNHMWIFINSLIENPTFDSQTKETLTLPASKFGTRPTLSEEFHKKVQKSSIVDSVLNWAKNRADQQLKKTDGNRRNRLTGLPKLSDANNAGTRKATDCTLILTEGDSAKSLAVAGLSVVGRDNYGVFPLRGKLLNVRDAKHDQIMKNEEIQNIKKILGLQHNKDYKDLSSLRYGQVMIMTDQDHDGSHIKGLILNYLDHFYPSLLKIPKFVVEFVTPIVRVMKGNQKINFFTIPEYEQWLENTADAHKWKSKYYKGLGTSQDSDAREYFSQMNKHMIPFSTIKEEERSLIDLAFSKKKADDRKEWLRQLKPGTFLDHSLKEISVTEFINHELILFSMADNVRSIPSVADGLKPGQRKVIWGCFKRKLKSEIKVAQLTGYISEKACYHHGEQSLQMTIVNLAQDFVGSNNINLLMPNGQFGTRDQGGKDHASARYIFTEPSPVARAIFHPADDPLLKYMQDDNINIEPEWYVPVIPLVLVNGAEGIGTGWSTNVPCYNPMDIVNNIRRIMKGEEQETMLPWWRGFKGTIKKVADFKYDVIGIVNKLDDTTVEITELPIHKWTQNYKAELEAMCGEKGEGPIKDYKEYHDNTNVHFIVQMTEKGMEKAEAQGLHEFFKLTSKVNTSNMICFDFDGKIKKYNSPEEIIEEFYPIRLQHYQKRKDFLANELQDQLDKLTNQARFIRMIVNKELVINNRKKADIVAELRKLEFRPFPKIVKAKAAGETEEVLEQEEEEEEEKETGTTSDYDYLLGMAISSLTKEKIDKLVNQANEKETELMTLLELTPIQIWNTDLDKFVEEWESAYRSWEDKAIKPGQKKGKKKQQTLAGMMRKGVKKENGSDDDDDFKPTKAASKPKKAPESKAAVKKPPVPSSSKVEIKDEDDDVKVVAAVKKPAAKKAPAKKKADDSDFDDDDPPPAKKTAARKAITKIDSDSDDDFLLQPKKAATKKSTVKVDIDSDDDKPDPPPKRAAAKKKAVMKVDSDSDVEMVDDPAPKKTSPGISDDSYEMVASTDSKGKGKAKAAPKRKTPEEEDSDDDSPKAKKKKSVADYFNKPAAAKKATTTTRKVSATKPKAAPKKAAKKVAESDDEVEIDDDDNDVPAPPPPKRAARAVKAQPKQYIEVASSDDGGKDESEFEDFD
ncbi:DNA topoisomerase [Abortiporus biennis]|nr:DNA topoisomerase [Abortiporus biennis]